jgi:hypothetical protein
MTIQLSPAEVRGMNNAELFTDTDAMYKIAPSLFATHAHPRMSEKYAFTNTYDILLHIHNRGYRVTSIQGGDSTYKKVMIRMRSKHHIGKNNAPEIVILDSHDGSSRLKMLLGIIKFACMNGMIVGDMFYSRAFTHRSIDLMEQVKLELLDIDTHIDALNNRIERMASYTTTLADRITLVEAVVKERWGEDKDQSFIAEMRQHLLTPRRREDSDNDMYTVMNVIQENVLRGGMSYVSPNNRVVAVRPISDVRRNLGINQTVWNTAETLMATREAA